MALISCPECGREISDKAFACPHCGNPMNPQPQQVQQSQQEESLCCPKCGTPLNKGVRFCPKCGTPCNSSFTQSVEERKSVEKNSPTKFPLKPILAVILTIACIGGGWFARNVFGNCYSLEGLAKAIPNYDYVGDFSEGLASVREDGKAGFIDKTGKLIIPCRFRVASPFSEGLASVREDGKAGFIDKTGKLIIPCIYDYAFNFSEGLSRVSKDGKYGFIDKTGKFIIPCIYDSAGDFSEGLASVREDGKDGFIDKKGNSTFDVKDENVQKIVEEKRAEKARKDEEEENKPVNKFNSLVSQGYVWQAKNIDISPNGKDVVLLYFYPKNTTSGIVSLISCPSDYHSFYLGKSTRALYFISGNSLTFKGTFENGMGFRWNRDFNMTIENRNGNIILSRVLLYSHSEETQEFHMRSKPFDDQLIIDR